MEDTNLIENIIKKLDIKDAQTAYEFSKKNLLGELEKSRLFKKFKKTLNEAIIKGLDYFTFYISDKDFTHKHEKKFLVEILEYLGYKVKKLNNYEYFISYDINMKDENIIKVLKSRNAQNKLKAWYKRI